MSPSTAPGARRLIVLYGEPAATRAEAARLVAALDDVLAVGPDDTPAARTTALLGGAWDAVVIDAHRDRAGGLDPDVLGRCHGFVRGGGALILRMDPEPHPRAALAAWPFPVDAVGTRFQRRFRAIAQRYATVPPNDAPLARPAHTPLGTDEQAAVVAALTRALADPTPSCTVVLADRGRGKSAALGLALAASPGCRAALTAAHDTALDAVLAFTKPLPTPSLGELLEVAPDHYDAIVVDEAAQIPVPVLRALTRRHARTRFVFATTARGYEGTGRGFVLRFLEELARGPRPLVRLTMDAPIRWAAGDPLERFVFEALLLDAEPDAPPPAPLSIAASPIDRDAVSERDLGAAFGLLVHAHYRTTPGDLERMMDAPNLGLHVLRADSTTGAALDREGGAIVGACLVAREGGLPAELVEDLARGRRRIKAHALADSLVAHLGRRDAGPLTMLRSVRIAVHPDARRAGLARALVEHVHASHDVDLFGTLFGATPELVRFRRQLGYRLVRLSASRGARTGEPSALMLRPVTAAAEHLVTALEADLARNLALQLQLLQSDHDLVDPMLLDPAPVPVPAPDSDLITRIADWVTSPRTVESAIADLATFVAAHLDHIDDLDPIDRAVLTTRLIDLRSWSEAAQRAGLAHAGQAMKRARPAIAALLGTVQAAHPNARQRSAPTVPLTVNRPPCTSSR